MTLTINHHTYRLSDEQDCIVFCLVLRTFGLAYCEQWRKLDEWKVS